eukprot:1070598-Amphidinium_carterae.1
MAELQVGEVCRKRTIERYSNNTTQSQTARTISFSPFNSMHGRGICHGLRRSAVQARLRRTLPDPPPTFPDAGSASRHRCPWRRLSQT